MEAGLNAVVDEQYQVAAQILVSALTGAHRNSLVLARDPKSRESKLEALIYLARSYKHLGRIAERDQVMTEVIRSYPDKVITAKKYGSDAEEIYAAVKRNLDRGGQGQLAVTVTDPAAVIYVDEIARGLGQILVADLLPGPHRVLVEAPTGARQYRATVIAHRRARLAIDWEVDAMLVTGGWVGFQLPTEQDREREGLLARKLVADRTNAVMVIVLSASLVDRRVIVRGTMHAVVSGKVARSARVELTGRTDTDRQKLDQLAAFLGFQSAGKDVAVLSLAPPELTSSRGTGSPEPCPCPCATSAARPSARGRP